MTSNKDKEIIEKARQTGIEYFKKNYSIDVVFTEYKVMAPYVTSSVSMQGHVQGAEDETLYLMIDYRTYEIVQGFVFDGFAEKYPKNEKVNPDPILKEKSKN